jgi:hypothetical protein
MAVARGVSDQQATIMPERKPIDVCGICFEAFPVEHSILAPAVGYRIAANRRSAFYVPDVVTICDPAAALRGIDLYTGDGATVTRPIIRRRGAVRIGHTPIRTQLDWCRAQLVRRAIFTHCGSQIVSGDERVLAAHPASGPRARCRGADCVRWYGTQPR